MAREFHIFDESHEARSMANAVFKSAELFLFFCKCRNGFSNVSGTYDAALCGRFL